MKVLGRLIAERGRSFGQGQVVVDGLRHVDVGDRIFLLLEELGDAVRGRSGIVSAHRHQQFHIVRREEIEVEIVGEILVRRLETAHLQVGTAPVEDVVGQEIVYIHHPGILLEKPRVAFVQTDHTVTLLQKRLGHAADHGVHTGCRASSRQNCDCIFHCWFEFISY